MGMNTMVNGVSVKFLERHQPIVAKITCEVEYLAVAEAATPTTRMHKMTAETGLSTERQPCTSTIPPRPKWLKAWEPHSTARVVMFATIICTTSSKRENSPSAEYHMHQKAQCNAVQETQKTTHKYAYPQPLTPSQLAHTITRVRRSGVTSRKPNNDARTVCASRPRNIRYIQTPVRNTYVIRHSQ